MADKIDLSAVVQTTMLEAFERKDDIPPNPNERLTWLRRVFLNNLCDSLRQLRTQKRNIDLERSIDESTSRISNRLCSDESTPSIKVSRREQTEILLRAIAELPPSQRAAIEMHHLQGLPLEEISQQMQKPKGAIAALIYRGMKTLRSNSALEDLE